MKYTSASADLSAIPISTSIAKLMLWRVPLSESQRAVRVSESTATAWTMDHPIIHHPSLGSLSGCPAKSPRRPCPQPTLQFPSHRIDGVLIGRRNCPPFPFQTSSVFDFKLALARVLPSLFSISNWHGRAYFIFK